MLSRHFHCKSFKTKHSAQRTQTPQSPLHLKIKLPNLLQLHFYFGNICSVNKWSALNCHMLHINNCLLHNCTMKSIGKLFILAFSLTNKQVLSRAVLQRTGICKRVSCYALFLYGPYCHGGPNCLVCNIVLFKHFFNWYNILCVICVIDSQTSFHKQFKSCLKIGNDTWTGKNRLKRYTCIFTQETDTCHETNRVSPKGFVMPDILNCCFVRILMQML